MKNYKIWAISVLVFSVWTGGCSSRKSEPLQGPVKLHNEEVKRGQVLYMRHCQKCHPFGEGGLAPAISSNPAPGFVKRFQIRHGLGVMPSFKENELSKAESRSIIQYLKALKQN